MIGELPRQTPMGTAPGRGGEGSGEHQGARNPGQGPALRYRARMIPTRRGRWCQRLNALVLEGRIQEWSRYLRGVHGSTGCDVTRNAAGRGGVGTQVWSREAAQNYCSWESPKSPFCGTKRTMHKDLSDALGAPRRAQDMIWFLQGNLIL